MIIDSKYLLIKRFGNQDKPMKVVFLVQDIETSIQYVLKLFLPDETDQFLKEVKVSYMLKDSKHYKKAIAYREARTDMEPIIINNITFNSYSYILFPFASKGDLIDFYKKPSTKVSLFDET